MKKWLLAFMTYLMMTQLWAAPAYVEVWFLSSPTSSARHPLIAEPPLKMSSLEYAQYDDETHLNCNRMGDEYFHPQSFPHLWWQSASSIGL